MTVTVPAAPEIPVQGERLCGLTWLRGRLWYSDAGLQQILAVDPATGRTVRRLACPDVRTGLTTLSGRLLQVVGADRRLRAIDPGTGATVDEYANPRPSAELCGLEAAGGALWMGYKSPGLLDERTFPGLALTDTVPVPEDVAGVTVVDRFVVYASYTTARLHVVDPRTKQVILAFGVAGRPTGLTWDGRQLWYCDYENVRLRAVTPPGLGA